MPTVTKTTMKTSKPSGGILSRITPVASIEKKMKLLVYGRSKTGKTRLFSTFPKKALLIGTEDGTNSIADSSGVDFVKVNTSEEFGELVSYLRSEGRYSSACLDTGGGLQDIIVKEVLDLDEVPVQRSYGMGSGKFKDGRQMWGVVGMQFKEHVNRFLKLAEDGVIHVVIIAHERNFNDEGGGHELMTPTVGAALTPSVTGWLNGACDYICQAYIREETVTAKIKIPGKGEVDQTKKTGKAEYCLRIGSHPIYITGFRVPRKIGELPDCIVDPDYDKIQRIIKGA